MIVVLGKRRTPVSLSTPMKFKPQRRSVVEGFLVREDQYLMKHRSAAVTELLSLDSYSMRSAALELSIGTTNSTPMIRNLNCIAVREMNSFQSILSSAQAVIFANGSRGPFLEYFFL